MFMMCVMSLSGLKALTGITMMTTHTMDIPKGDNHLEVADVVQAIGPACVEGEVLAGSFVLQLHVNVVLDVLSLLCCVPWKLLPLVI